LIFEDKAYYLSMGIKEMGLLKYDAFNGNMKLELLNAPGWMVVNEVTPSNLFCRYKSNLLFEL
jgi:hypothetical protein